MAVSFEDAWDNFIGDGKYEPGSRELNPLIGAVYDEIAARPANLPQLKFALRQLLDFLASPKGRTDSNCRITDSFFSLSDDLDWGHLPDEFGGILSDMAGALHDTLSLPHRAENCDSTPEQLLHRLDAIEVS